LRTVPVEGLLYEALDKVAAPAARDALITEALEADARRTLPTRPELLSDFVTGPLCTAARARLGPEAADALLQDLGPLLRLAAANATQQLAPAERKSRTLPPPSPSRFGSGVVVRNDPCRAPTPPRMGRMTAPYLSAWTDAAPRNLVVVVDDDGPFLSGFGRLLRLEGYDVLTAPDAQTALALCQRLRPQVLVTDLDMPAVDGAELASRILLELGEAAPTVLMLTGTSTPPDRVAGVARVLTKGDDVAELVAAIEQAVTRP